MLEFSQDQISNLTSLASFGGVLALMTPQEDVAKSIATKLKGQENAKENNTAVANTVWSGQAGAFARRSYIGKIASNSPLNSAKS